MTTLIAATRLRTAARRALIATASAAALAVSVALPATAASPAGGPHDVNVLTQNLFLGTDLKPVIEAFTAQPPDLGAILAATNQAWDNVVASDPEGRMAAVAREIAKDRPDLVGLQEVETWTHVDASTSPPTVTGYDFQALLLADLAALGAPYAVVPGATSTNFNASGIPLSATTVVSETDHDVILYRTDVPRTSLTLSGAQHGTFVNVLPPFQTPLGPLAVPRGWGSVDVTTGTTSFRFVNTHTESEGPDILRVAESAELLAAVGNTSLPLVIVGDFNSDALASGSAGDAYRFMTETAGLHDAWSSVHPGQAGATWGDAPLDVWPPTLTQRIDFVFTSDGRALTAKLLGLSPADRTPGGLRPSDHVGLAAKVTVP